MDEKTFKNMEPIKFDSTKIQLDLLPPDALIVIGQVLTHGAKKYEPRNWERGIDWSRYISALLRHMLLFMAGDSVDPDSELPIMAHIACNALFLLSSQLRDIGDDKRWKLPNEYLMKLRKCVDDFNTIWDKQSEENGDGSKFLTEPYEYTAKSTADS